MVLNKTFRKQRYGLPGVNRHFVKESAPIVEEEKGGYNLSPPLISPSIEDDYPWLSTLDQENVTFCQLPPEVLEKIRKLKGTEVQQTPPVPVMYPIWPGVGIKFIKERRPKPFMYLTDEDHEEYKKEQEEWEEWQKDNQ